MKKVFLLALLVMLLTSLIAVGCGAKEVTPTGTATAPPTQTAAKAIYKLKYADWDPEMSVYIRCFVRPYKALIERETGGRVQIDLYLTETLVKRADLHDALLSGIADIVLEGVSNNPGRWPLMEIMGSPTLYKDAVTSGLALWDAYKEGVFLTEQQDVKRLNNRCVTTRALRARAGYIKTLEDFKGLKHDGTGFVMQEAARLLGTTAVAVTGPDTYDALQKGMIDFSFHEWEGMWIWRKCEVTKYPTDGFYMFGPSITGYSMSLNTYNKLPADIQAVFDKYSGNWMNMVTNVNMERENWWRYDQMVEFDKKVGNQPVYNMPPAEAARLRKALEPIAEKLADDAEKKGLPAKAALARVKGLVAKYEAMYPKTSEAMWKLFAEYGQGYVFPGYPAEFVMPNRPTP